MHEKVFNITNHQRNVSQNHNEISMQASETGYYCFKKEVTSISENVEKKKNLWPVAGSVNWCSSYGDSMTLPPNIKNRTTIWSSHPTSGDLYEENEISISKIYLHPRFTAALLACVKTHKLYFSKIIKSLTYSIHTTIFTEGMGVPEVCFSIIRERGDGGEKA